MMRIESCEYDMDTGCIDISYPNGKKLSIYIPFIEESLRTTVYSRSRLDLLLDSDPLCSLLDDDDAFFDELIESVTAEYVTNSISYI